MIQRYACESGSLRLLDDPERGIIVEELVEEVVSDRNHLRSLIGKWKVFKTVLQIKEAFFEHGDKEPLRCCIKAITFCCTECGGKLQDFTQIKLKESVGSINEIIEVMGDKVGKSLKVVVKRANNNLVTLYVVPKEANPDS